MRIKTLILFIILGLLIACAPPNVSVSANENSVIEQESDTIVTELWNSGGASVWRVEDEKYGSVCYVSFFAVDMSATGWDGGTAMDCLSGN